MWHWRGIVPARDQKFGIFHASRAMTYEMTCEKYAYRMICKYALEVSTTFGWMIVRDFWLHLPEGF